MAIAKAVTTVKVALIIIVKVVTTTTVKVALTIVKVVTITTAKVVSVVTTVKETRNSIREAKESNKCVSLHAQAC